MENFIDTLKIDLSETIVTDKMCESLLLSEELLEKYRIVIDENKIEQIIAEIPEEKRHVLTFEEKLHYIKQILDYDVSVPIRNLFNDVLHFVSKRED